MNPLRSPLEDHGEKSAMLVCVIAADFEAESAKKIAHRIANTRVAGHMQTTSFSASS